MNEIVPSQPLTWPQMNRAKAEVAAFYPDWFAGPIAHAVRALKCSQQMAIAQFTAAISAATQDWHVQTSRGLMPLSVWTVVHAESGAGYSNARKHFFAPLLEVDEERRSTEAEELDEYEIMKLALARRVSKLTSQMAAQEQTSSTYQRLLDELKRVYMTRGKEPRSYRRIYGELNIDEMKTAFQKHVPSVYVSAQNGREFLGRLLPNHEAMLSLWRDEDPGFEVVSHPVLVGARFSMSLVVTPAAMLKHRLDNDDAMIQLISASNYFDITRPVPGMQAVHQEDWEAPGKSWDDAKLRLTRLALMRHRPRWPRPVPLPDIHLKVLEERPVDATTDWPEFRDAASAKRMHVFRNRQGEKIIRTAASLALFRGKEFVDMESIAVSIGIHRQCSHSSFMTFREPVVNHHALDAAAEAVWYVIQRLAAKGNGVFSLSEVMVNVGRKYKQKETFHSLISRLQNMGRFETFKDKNSDTRYGRLLPRSNDVQDV